jgi:hypothetical protein
MDEETCTIRERIKSLETGRADDQRAVALVADNLKEKVDSLKTLVTVVSGILILILMLAGVLVAWKGHTP